MGVRRAHAVTDGRRLGQLARPSGVDAPQHPAVPIYVGCPTQSGGWVLLSALQRPRAQAVTNAGSTIRDEFWEMTLLLVGSSQLMGPWPGVVGREAITEAMHEAELILRLYDLDPQSI